VGVYHLTKCPVHGDDLEIVLFCKKCTRPMSEEFHEKELKESLTEYYDLKKKGDEITLHEEKRESGV